MLISEMWKQRTIEVLTTLYGDEINKEYLEQYLDNQIKAKQANFPQLSMRNLYTTEHFQIPLDSLLETVEKEDLCIEANNTLTYSLNRLESPLPIILIKQKAERNAHKKKMLKAKEEIAVMKKNGTFKDGCPKDIEMRTEDGMQLKIKTFMNSIYGVQGQKGSILYSPDTAGAVTSQGREMIAEMTWTTERLLYGTLHFYSIDEFLSYLVQVKKEIKYDSEWLKYISYIPTEKEVENKIIHSAMKSVTGLYNCEENIGAVVFSFIHHMNETERIYFYYSWNLFGLIEKNYKVFKLFDDLISLKIDYLAPASQPSEEVIQKYKDYLGLDYNNPDTIKNITATMDDATKKEFMNFIVYSKYNPTLSKICKLIEDLVMTHMSTPKRTLKYQTKRRRAIVVSDTDSVIVNLFPYVHNLYHLHCIENHIPYQGDHVAFYDEPMHFKLVNIMAYICTFGTVVAGDIFVKGAHIPQNYRKWVEMKNEFLFKRLVMYANAKKNYVVNTRLQEGKIIDDMPATGIKLNSSVIHPEVKKRIMDVIANKIIKSPTVNPIEILKSIKDIEKYIVDSIKGGDLTLGRKARYSGPRGYKTGVYRNDAGRAAFIWNILYPNSKINPGDYGSIFSTTILTADDVGKKMAKRFPQEAQILLDKIFADKNLAPYGLRSIMIPLNNESVKKLPDWLIPYIDYAKITNRHMQSLISLTSSLGLRMSAISSSKQSYSPLISF